MDIPSIFESLNNNRASEFIKQQWQKNPWRTAVLSILTLSTAKEINDTYKVSQKISTFFYLKNFWEHIQNHPRFYSALLWLPSLYASKSFSPEISIWLTNIYFDSLELKFQEVQELENVKLWFGRIFLLLVFSCFSYLIHIGLHTLFFGDPQKNQERKFK